MTDLIELRWQRRSWWTVNGVVALVYFLLAYLGDESGLILFDNLTLFWPPSGIALAAILYFGNRAAAGIWLGSLLGNLVVFQVESPGISLLINVGIGAGSALQALLGGGAIRRLCAGRNPLGAPGDAMKFVAISVASATISATIAAPILRWAGLVSPDELLPFATTWWLGDATGMLLVTPLIFAWVQTRLPAGASLAEGLALLVLTAGVGQVVFAIFGGASSHLPLEPLFIPLFVWAILRFGARGATLLTVLVYVMAMIATPLGRGPLATDTHLVSVLMLQLFIGAFSMAALALSSMLLARERAEHSLRSAHHELEARVGLRTVELSESNEQLVRERNFGAAVLDLAGALVMVMDRAGRIVRFNRACQQMTGRGFPDAEEERAWERLLPARAIVPFRAELDRLVAGGPARPFESVWVSREGRERVIAWSEAAIEGERGRAEFLIFSGLDVTDRERAAEVQARALEREREARIEAQKSVQLRDDFISIASHELRTPLTPLKINAELLKMQLARIPDASLPNAALLRRVVDNVQREVARLLGLVEGILDVSRVAAGRLALHDEPIDLSELARVVAERFKPQLASARCDLTLDAPSVPVLGSWDRARLEQVLTNLLSNAIKYGAGHPIEVSTSVRGATARLVVRDHGAGVKQEDRERIFSRFERAAPIEHFGGLGLGLYVTRGIVTAHGGSIEVQSHSGEGASFVVELPTRRLAKDGAAFREDLRAPEQVGEAAR